MDIKSIVNCQCYFCALDKDHPMTIMHSNYYSIGTQLLVAESLDEKDSMQLEACETCGHKRVVKDAK